MKYVDYLKTLEIDGEIFFPEEDYEITSEVNINVDNDKTQIIVNEQMGSITEDGNGKIVPIYMRILTSDLETTREKLQTFASKQNLKKSYVDNEYLQEFFNTDYISETFTNKGINYTNELVLTGVIIVTTGILDIKEVYIDSTKVETSSRTLSYTAVVQNYSKGNQMINETTVNKSNLKLNITAINKTDSYLSTMTRQIRKGNVPIDKKYAIKLVFVDDSMEEYSMKIVSFNLNSTNDTLPALPIEFMQ